MISVFSDATRENDALLAAGKQCGAFPCKETGSCTSARGWEEADRRTLTMPSLRPTASDDVDDDCLLRPTDIDSTPCRLASHKLYIRYTHATSREFSLGSACIM